MHFKPAKKIQDVKPIFPSKYWISKSWDKQKKKAAAQNPWGEGATTLEWTVPSPPNFHTFEELPKFEDDESVEKSIS